MNKMSEVDDVISRLTAKQQNYLNSYFTYAPESLKSSIQVVRMPAGTTFIQEGAPLDKVFILLKGSVSAVDYRVRETVYGFCHFEPIENLRNHGNSGLYEPLQDYIWLPPRTACF